MGGGKKERGRKKMKEGKKERMIHPQLGDFSPGKKFFWIKIADPALFVHACGLISPRAGCPLHTCIS